MRNVFLGLILTLLFGGVMTANAQSSQEISVRLNKQTKASRSKLTVKFLSVEDSRCPQDVDCVWAGNAKVTVKITNSKGKSQTFDLNTNIQQKSVKFEGYEIALGAVTPYPRSNIRINPSGYTASFTITKL